MKSIFSPSPNKPVESKKKDDDYKENSSSDKDEAPNKDRRRQKHTLPLSMQLMKPFAGLMLHANCTDCGKGSHSWPPRHLMEEVQNEQDDDDDDDGLTQKYNDLFCQATTTAPRSSISPMVVAPMMHSPTNNTKHVELVLHDYQVACTFYKCPLNPGALTTFRYALPSLKVSGNSFHDVDMLALVEVLLKYCNNYLSFIRRLDFSNATKEPKRPNTKYRGFRSHGALALAKLLQQSQHVSEVLLQRNRIGPYGASAIFLAASENKTLHHINMRRCRIMERGGLAFSELIAANTTKECGLNDVNLSANFIGFRASMAIEQALTKRDETMNLLLVDLEGNLVFQEIMNGVTHGLGMLLAVLGGLLLSKRVQHKPEHYQLSCAVYSLSLLVLYTSSTFYHSFFALQNPKYIFEVLDKCAIYILIAGSYTPFLSIIFAETKLYSTYLLIFIWTCCFLGIYIEFAHPIWKHKALFSLSMYLGMGWAALVVIPAALQLVSLHGVEYVCLGGVAYTSGVPFFVRNNNLDHSIWHLFVLLGSGFHWWCIYEYVVTWQDRIL